MFMPYANNKGADHPAHPRSLISAFVVRCLDGIIPLDSISEISSYRPNFCGYVDRFEFNLVANPEDRFSPDEAQGLNVALSMILISACSAIQPAQRCGFFV